MKSIQYYVDFHSRRVNHARVPPDLEAKMVQAFFDKKMDGFFVDVGANDPFLNSQSFHLEQLGWKGILIEPLSIYCELLRKNRTAVIVECACSSRENDGKKLMINVAGTHSTLERKLMAKGGRVEATQEVEVRTLDFVLQANNVEVGFDLLSVDVEGHEMELFDGFSIEYWRPRLFLLEDHVFDHKKHNYMSRHGYHLIFSTGLNSWYVSRSENYVLSLSAKLEFIRKYWFGLLFRRFKFRSTN